MGDRGVEEFISSYKKAIKMVTVTINEKQVELPITYSMNASIKYQDGYRETNDYRLAFCIMVLAIVKQNKKFVDNNNELPDLEIEGIESIGNDGLRKIGEIIIASSQYLKEIEEAYSSIEDFFEKFYLVNKRESEKITGTISKIIKPIKPISIPNNSLRLINQVSGISGQLSWGQQYQETLKPALGIASSVYKYNKVFESMQKYNNFPIINSENLLKSLESIRLQQNSVSSAVMKQQKIWGQVASSISNWKEIYSPSVIKSIQNFAVQESAIKKVLYNPLKEFESAIKGITTVTAAEKIFEFTSLREEVMRSFKPFILTLQSINIERLAIKEELRKRAEILGQFGWWYISDISEEVIDKIMEESEYLSDNDVNEIICNLFRDNNFNNLDKMLDTWGEISFLKKKYVLLEEAIYAHKNGKYTSSIQSLITNGEGIIRDFVRETCGFTRRGWGPVYDKFKNMVKELEEFLYGYLMNFIDYLYMNFDPEYPEQTNDFNRHKIMHGESINHGTEVNSLKTILYINEIYHIINALIVKKHDELVSVI